MPENQHSILDDILIVDDDIANLKLMSDLLGRKGYQVRPANNPQLAIDSALECPPKLILLDVRMPGIDGYEVSRRLKKDERTKDIPILFVSALHDAEDKIYGFEAGGVDFISKPFQESEILARVRTHVDLRNLQLNLEAVVSKRTAELMESERRFRVTFEQAAVGIAHVSLDGKFLRLNEKFCEIVGYLQDEMLDLSFQNITHPDDLDIDLQYLQQLLEGKLENYTIEKRYYRKDGSIVWVNLNVSLLFDTKGNPEYFVSVIKDITSRKQSEEMLKQSNERFQLAFDIANIAICLVGTDGHIKIVNDQMCSMFGYDKKELESMTVNDIAYPEDLDLSSRFIQSAIKDEIERNRFIKRYIHKDGHIVWGEVSSSIVRDTNGNPQYFISYILDITERKLAENKLKEAYQEVEHLQKQLQAESNYLQEEIKLEHNFENIIGQSEALKYVLHRVEQVASKDSTVLILGETGTGKELIARAIHKLSKRSKRPLVKVNCAALPRELIESELFGREKGAFTGATTTQLGRFELANETTLFLDEIGELPLELQAKLLRVIESGEFERLGNSRTLHSGARIIAATNRNLEEEVRKNRFREDLLYRLKIFPITIPPLHERNEDIPLLVNSFVNFFARKMGIPHDVQVPKKAMNSLMSYHWPGNVRELKHVVESAMITVHGKKLNFDLPKSGSTPSTILKPLDEMERDYILKVLKAKKWKIGGENSAASVLGMPSSTLRSRMKKLGIKRP